MKKILLILATGLCLMACKKEAVEKEHVDMILTNGKIYTVDSTFSNATAFAVQDGKFVAVGTNDDVRDKYTADTIIDASGKTILPGLIDAHCHFYEMGTQQQTVNLVGTRSYEEVQERVMQFQARRPSNFIMGGGWDQNDWENKEFPTKDRLDELFKNVPVVLQRIDGHALLANQQALDLAGINTSTKIEGGEVIKKDGKLTGVLIDNAMQPVFKILPKMGQKESIKALMDAQKACFNFGLTTVNEAGISRKIIELIDSLQKENTLDMRIYAMVSNTPADVDYYLEKGIYKTPRLNVRSVKVYGDGALGSRGAALRAPYADRANHFGAMVTPIDSIESVAKKLAASEFQMNTHAIGDSANHVVLTTYDEVLQGQDDRRWKVEHAQVISPEDFKYFSKNILPSVQPTHATSDMPWAQDRLGAERMKGAYAYKQLLQESGVIALGTDFPVEAINPFLTFYAAVARKDVEGNPEEGFQMSGALSREEALRGMTIWAAYTNFEEDEKGSIEAGKYADFIMMDKDIMTINLDQIPRLEVNEVYLDGKKVKG
ncbi:MAG: amidohydrolase [Cytophagaceae bacterium]|nr:amidohydrolase [Cytophagaceae bacterium]|tara:strand:- start:803 stop:2440 length:1638 start_codon:yes stop_codon:yes gene_type:complete